MIDWFKPTYWGKEEEYVLDAVKSTWISGGLYIDKFEKHFSEILNSKITLTVSNGTTALHLALLTLDIGIGDEVIVPGYTFAAPVNMALIVGATPVYVDVSPDTWCIDEKKIEAAITENTKAIIPVHTYGNICNMPAINEIANRYNLSVIEDTAEAAFSTLDNQMAGTFSDVGCFSFQATKTITMGEGGAITLKNEELADKAKLIRSHGMYGKKRYWHYAVGHNFRLTNYQAALGCAQLEHINKIIENKKRVLNLYQKYLDKANGIQFQYFAPNVDPVPWAVAIKIDETYFPPVNTIRDYLMEHSIETRTGFFTFHDMPLYHAPFLPVSQSISKSIISLPSHALIEEETISYVCNKIMELRK